jgi:hypothetical protein
MSFGNLKTDDSIQEDGDRIGGGLGPLDSGIYNCTISMAYQTESQGGALGVVLHLGTEDGRELRQTVYVTSGKAKGQSNTYLDKNGEKRYLPGFTLINHLCLLTAGKELSEMATEEKVIKVWNFDAKAEVPTQVPVLTGLLGKEVIAAVFKQIVDKRARGDDGNYHPTGETREENEIDKFFRKLDRMTVAEIKAQELSEGVFIDQWAEKHAGQVRDRSSKTGTTPAAALNKPAQGGAGNQPRPSLFA